MSEFVKLTASIGGEKRSVVLPRDVWEREIALIVNKYSQGVGVSEVHTSVKDIQVESEMNAGESWEEKRVREHNEWKGK